LNKNKKKAEKFEIKDIEENLKLLCKNLDSNFLGYDHEDVRKFLKEAKTSIKVFADDIFIKNCGGERFLRYIEDYNSENGSFEDIIKQEHTLFVFYTKFAKILSKCIINMDPSNTFRLLVEEIDNYIKKKTLRILHELGDFLDKSKI